MQKKRDEFSLVVKRALAKRAGEQCSFLGCALVTCGPGHENPMDTINLGQACHIEAAAPGGPRYNSGMTIEARRDINNGIWLCGHHADLVDKDPSAYTVEILRQYKKQHEERIKTYQIRRHLVATAPSQTVCHTTLPNLHRENLFGRDAKGGVSKTAIAHHWLDRNLSNPESTQDERLKATLTISSEISNMPLNVNPESTQDERLKAILTILQEWASEHATKCGFIELYVCGSLLQRFGMGFRFEPNGSDIDLLIEFDPDHDTAIRRAQACHLLRKQTPILEKRIRELFPAGQILSPESHLISIGPITKFELDWAIHRSGDFNNSLEAPIHYPLVRDRSFKTPTAFGIQNKTIFRAVHFGAYAPLSDCQAYRYEVVKPILENAPFAGCDDGQALPKKICRAAAQLRNLMWNDLEKWQLADAPSGALFLEQNIPKHSEAQCEEVRRLLAKIQIRRQAGDLTKHHFAFEPFECQLMFEILSDIARDFLMEKCQSYAKNPPAAASFGVERVNHYPGMLFDSNLYISRPVEEKEILDRLSMRVPSAIFGPAQYGKSWILDKILSDLSKERPNLWIIRLRWKHFERLDKQSPETIMDRFINMIISALKNMIPASSTDPRTLKTRAWEQNEGNMDRGQGFLTLLFDAFPDNDLLMVFPKVDSYLIPVTENLFVMLSRWADDNTLKHRRRLLMLFSLSMTSDQAVAQFPDSVIHRNPVALKPFNDNQVMALGKQFRDDLNLDQAKRLVTFLGGHPFLTAWTLYQAQLQNISLDAILEDPNHEIFTNHLNNLSQELESWPILAEGLVQIVDNPETGKVKGTIRSELNRMGLIRVQSGRAFLASPLYRHLADPFR